MSEIEYKFLRKNLIKSYFQEALSLCVACHDVQIEGACTTNCSQQYLAFMYGKKLVEQKFSQCKTSCSAKNSSEIEKCMNNCYQNSSEDLLSLDKLLKL